MKSNLNSISTLPQSTQSSTLCPHAPPTMGRFVEVEGVGEGVNQIGFK